MLLVWSGTAPEPWLRRLVESLPKVVNVENAKIADLSAFHINHPHTLSFLHDPRFARPRRQDFIHNHVHDRSLPLNK